MLRSALAVVAAVLVVTSACGDDEAGPPPAMTDPAQVGQLTVEVSETYPHDRSAFTQGLLVSPEGTLFESTGLRGRSTLREVDLETGEVLRSVSVDDVYFAEGLTLVDDRLIQLTWQAGVALVYDRETFELLDQYEYSGEGWGLCYDDDRLVMSDGSAELTFRDPETFEEIGTVEVRAAGDPVPELNELECVGDHVWANVWQTDRIVEIDPATGEVVATVDASGLLSPAQQAGTDVLNGIAYDDGNEQFYVTGKRWPQLFAVEFVPSG